VKNRLHRKVKRLKEKKHKNVPNKKSLGSASRRPSTERIKTKKNLFCAEKLKKIFLVFLLSVEALLEADPNGF
jgi:hypothetical protein